MSQPGQSSFSDDPTDGLDALGLVQGGAGAALSLWRELADAPEEPDWLIGHAAMSVLSMWAHLQRFEPKTLDAAVWQMVDTVVQQDAETLLAAFSLIRPLANFREQIEAIESDWDLVADDDAAEPLVDRTSQLFCLLDDASLALAASDILLKKGRLATNANPTLADMRQDILASEQFLADDVSRFISVGGWASWMLDAYRLDLDQDALLWGTTLKYRRLEEEFESLEYNAPETSTLPIRGMIDWYQGEQIAERYRTSVLDSIQPKQVEPRADDRLHRFRIVREYQRDYGELAAAGTHDEGPVFPPIGADVPQVALWRMAEEFETSAESTPHLAIWCAFFNARFFLFANAATDHLNAWKQARVMWAPEAQSQVKDSIVCPRIGDVARGRAWNFLPLLDSPNAVALSIYAVPIDRAVELAEKSGIVQIAVGDRTIGASVPSWNDCRRISPQLPVLWSILQDLSLRSRADAAKAALLGIILGHEYRSRTVLSETLAFYTYWIVQVLGPGNVRILDDSSIGQVLARFSQPSAWPSAFAERICSLIRKGNA